VSRVCVFGMGTPSFVPSRRHAGPGMRSAHFARALVRRGHEVLVVGVHGGATPLQESWPPDGGGRSLTVDGCKILYAAVEQRELAGGGVRAVVDRFAPDGFVAATAHAASLAVQVVGDVPLWADLFGDPMAEAQAKAAVYGSDVALVHFWGMLAPVLERADRFSAVSRAQADAVIGQLGLAGRLGAATVGEDLVAVIPCAAEAQGEEGLEDPLRGRCVPSDAFVVLWTGSFNTWCDVDTLVAGLDGAMDHEPRLHFAATGGAVEGHDERTHARFLELVRASRHAERYHLLGWLDARALAGLYATADVGINVERDLYERRLGSENRVVDWMSRGLPAVTTGLSELGRCLVARDLAFGCPTANPAALAALLSELIVDPERVRTTGAACRAHAALHLTFDARTEPLSRWCEAPSRARDADRPHPLVIGLMSEPKAMVQLLEAYLGELTLGQICYRSLRWLGRRLSGSAGSGESTGRWRG
jgi:glycosyltransferase involved in cell wall biosynthesis